MVERSTMSDSIALPRPAHRSNGKGGGKDRGGEGKETTRSLVLLISATTRIVGRGRGESSEEGRKGRGGERTPGKPSINSSNHRLKKNGAGKKKGNQPEANPSAFVYLKLPV